MEPQLSGFSWGSGDRQAPPPIRTLLPSRIALNVRRKARRRNPRPGSQAPASRERADEVLRVESLLGRATTSAFRRVLDSACRSRDPSQVSSPCLQAAFRSPPRVSQREILALLKENIRPIAAADETANDVNGASFCSLVDAADVFPDDSKKKKQHACEKGDQQQECRETLRRLVEKHFSVDGIGAENSRKQNRESAQNRRRPNRHDREREDSVERQLQKAQNTVLTPARVPFGALYRNPNLPEAHP